MRASDLDRSDIVYKPVVNLVLMPAGIDPLPDLAQDQDRRPNFRISFPWRTV